MKIVVESYLTERKLKAVLQKIYGNQWIGGQISLPGSRRKFDMAFRVRGIVILVEYDGDEHYRNSIKIKADKEKDVLAEENGMHLVRIPYWIQLDSVMVRHWFGIEVDIDQSFPHGFITTKLFPASFCELGIARFRQELASLPAEVRNAVIDSLREQVEAHGVEYVLPITLRTLVTTQRNTAAVLHADAQPIGDRT